MASPSPSPSSCPDVAAVHDLVDWYAQQQHWVSAQLELASAGAQRAHQQPAYEASPSPAPSSLSSSSTHERRKARHQRRRLHIQTRLFYLPRHSQLLKPHRHPKSTASSPHTTSSSSSAVAPTGSTRPSPGALTLVAMFGEMIGERMQMCMRLEEMVRDAVDRDQLTVVSDSEGSNY